METVQHELTLDVLNPRKNIIHVVQDDSKRTVKLNLLKDGLPFNIREDSESGLIGIVAFRKPDGHSGEYDTLSDGETPAVEEYRTTPQTPVVLSSWLVHLEGQVTACAGWTLLTIKFYKTDGQLIQTFPITLDVAKSATPLNEPSEDYHNVQSIADVLAVVGEVVDDVDSLKAADIQHDSAINTANSNITNLTTRMTQVESDVVDLKTVRVVRLSNSTKPSSGTTFQVSKTYIYPADGIKVGDYILLIDDSMCRVTAVYELSVEVIYIQKFGIDRSPLVVNITSVQTTADPTIPNRNNITSATIDKTLNEIKSADTLGKTVYMKYDAFGMRLPLIGLTSTTATFLFYNVWNPEDLSDGYSVMRINIDSNGLQSGYIQAGGD